MAHRCSESMCALRTEQAAAILLELIGRLPLETNRGLPRALPPAAHRQTLLQSLIADHQVGQHTVAGLEWARLADAVLHRPAVAGTPALDRAAHWRHALEVALLADALNDQAPKPDDPELLFAAGMLHDVGKLALDHLVPKVYARVRAETERHRLDPTRCERAWLGLDHTVAGESVAARCRLPEVLRQAVRLHHHPWEAVRQIAAHPEFVAKLQLANALAHRERFGHPQRRDDGIVRALVDHVGLAADSIDELATRSAKRAQTLYAVLLPALQLNERPPNSHSETHRAPGRSHTRSPSAAPHPATRWMASVSTFVGRLHPDDRPTDVCRNVARCCAELLDLDRAVAFTFDSTRTLYYCGVNGENRVTSEIIVVRPFDALVEDQFPPDAGDLFFHGLVPAPPIAAPAQERFRRVFTGESQTMLPMLYGGNLVGGVLFDSNPSRLSDVGITADCVQMLIGMFGAAVTHAAERDRTQRTIDRLTDPGDSAHHQPATDQTTASPPPIAEMAAGAAHELNTPLAVISGRAQILARDSDDPRVREALETIRKQTDVCSGIVDELIAFAKPSPPQPAFTVLGTWLTPLRESWLARFRGTPPELEIRLSDPQVKVWADPTQLYTILDALVANAVHATSPDNRRVMVNSLSATSDDMVVITVEDNGCGMSREVLKRVFDPFYSHRSAGRGRGLGLSMARRLAEINHGRLWIESAPDAGTTVFVELPANDPDTSV